MTYVKELGLYINKVEDLRDKVSEDLYAAIENLVVNAGEYTDREYRDLKSEFEAYESMLDSCHSVCYEVMNIMEKYEEKLNELYDYVSYAKRINRDKITGVLAEIDLDKISNSIAQTI